MGEVVFLPPDDKSGVFVVEVDYNGLWATGLQRGGDKRSLTCVTLRAGRKLVRLGREECLGKHGVILKELGSTGGERRWTTLGQVRTLSQQRRRSRVLR